MKWLDRLSGTPRYEDRVLPKGNPIGVAITGYVAADILSGGDPDLGDMAMFVAFPFIIAGAATAGAMAGVEELEARVRE